MTIEELTTLDKLIEKLRQTQPKNEVLAEAIDVIAFYVCIEYHEVQGVLKKGQETT